jgi:hypothetical protein
MNEEVICQRTIQVGLGVIVQKHLEKETKGNHHHTKRQKLKIPEIENIFSLPHFQTCR